MSEFLGFIHHWLYKKIRLLMEREALLVQRCDDEFDDLGSELYETPLAQYGEPLPKDMPLEQLIDHGNIHGWLHKEIMTAEVREAAFIKDIVDTLGDDGQQLVFSVFYDHGKECGQMAQEDLKQVMAQQGISEATPEAIYKAMQNYYLNGMPCDGGDQIIAASVEAFTWVGDHRLQRPNWKRSGVSLDLMTEAYQKWFQGFVETVAPGASFQVNDQSSPRTYEIHK